jgi:hypothetical protein
MGAGTRRALKRLVDAADAGDSRLRGKGAVGWCSVAPREEFSVLGRSRVLKPVDDTPVWSAVCFFVGGPTGARRDLGTLDRRALPPGAARRSSRATRRAEERPFRRLRVHGARIRVSAREAHRGRAPLADAPIMWRSLAPLGIREPSQRGFTNAAQPWRERRSEERAG